MKLVLPDLPAVVAGGYLHDARTAGGPDPYAHRLADRLRRQAVNHDLQDCPDPIGQFALSLPPEGRAKRGIGRGIEKFVARTDLAPTTDNSAGERHDDAFHLPHRLDSPLCRLQRAGQVFSQQEEIPAGHPLLHAETVLDHELTIHHWDPPKAPGAATVADDGRFQTLADLEAVPEKAELATH